MRAFRNMELHLAEASVPSWATTKMMLGENDWLWAWGYRDGCYLWLVPTESTKEVDDLLWRFSDQYRLALSWRWEPADTRDARLYLRREHYREGTQQEFATTTLARRIPTAGECMHMWTVRTDKDYSWATEQRMDRMFEIDLDTVARCMRAACMERGFGSPPIEIHHSGQWREGLL